ncbi:MAG: hypothetical protein GY749_09200 [Desulfobacteraceae bacterium]|nr:hypothetical protein [Desulfobacteraceae bacterium]
MVIIISIYNNCQFNATKNILWVSKPSRWKNNTVTVQERTDRIFVLNTNDMRDASSVKVIDYYDTAKETIEDSDALFISYRLGGIPGSVTNHRRDCQT